MNKENVRILISAFENWGTHHAWCAVAKEKENRKDCNCGYAAMRGLADELFKEVEAAP